MIKTLLLFIVTALTEILGCYLPYLWLNQGKSILLLIPTALSLALFAWLLSLHPAAAGRVYAAYGGVYICVAIMCVVMVSRWHTSHNVGFYRCWNSFIGDGDHYVGAKELN